MSRMGDAAEIQACERLARYLLSNVAGISDLEREHAAQALGLLLQDYANTWLQGFEAGLEECAQ